MPRTQTLGDMIKLGDLPLEQKEQIADAIIYSAKHNSEMFTQVNRAKLDSNKTTMTFMRSYLPKIDKTSDRYRNGLIEGVTPDPEAINEAEFSVSVIENGWYYKFTNKAINHAWKNIKQRCTKYLTNLFVTYHDEKIADAYLSSANTVTGFDPTSFKDLLHLKSILHKNGGKGEPILKADDEVIDAMIVAFKDVYKENKTNDIVLEGECGKVAGIRLVRSNLQAFEKVSTNHPFVIYCKNRNGEYPVTMCAYEGMAENIIVKPLGSLGDNDALNQRGSIGLYVDGHGFFVSDDSVCIRGVIADSTISSYTSSVTLANVTNGMFDDSARSNLTQTGGAREVVPQYDYVKIYRYSSGTTANTLVIGAKKSNGAEWEKASSGAGKLKVTSGNTSVATVAFASNVCTLTTAGVGLTTLVLQSVDNPNIKTVMTVEVVDGVGTGIIE